MKQGEVSSLGTIAKLLLVLIIVGLLLFLVYRYTSVFDKSLKECSGYCAQDCAVSVNGSVAGAPSPTGNDWCKENTWDISKEVVGVDGKKVAINQFILGFESKTQVKGSEAGLVCCIKTPWVENPPPSFIPKSFLIADGGSSGTKVTGKPPSVRVYFGNNALPLRNGEVVEVVSGKLYNYKISMTPGEISPAKGESGPQPAHTCKLRLIDEYGNNVILKDGNSIMTQSSGFVGPTQEITCDYSATSIVEKPWTIKLPSAYDGKTLKLQITFTKDANGLVDPNNGVDLLYQTSFRVINPIQFSSISSEWASSKRVDLSCKQEECSRFVYVIDSTTCDSTTTFNEQNEVQYTSQGRGYFVVETAGTHYPCVRAETKTGEKFYKRSSVPINIDRIPPQGTAEYNFLSYSTTITCIGDSQSGCANTVGYHYITRTVDFIGALFSGVSDTSNCPDDQRQYIWVGATTTQPTQGILPGSAGGYQGSGYGSQAIPANYKGPYYGNVPYLGGADFRVLCTMVKDKAGNTNKDIILTYSTFEILAQVAGDQQSRGGPGSSYYGYGFP